MKFNLLFSVFALSIGLAANSQQCDPNDYNWGTATYGVSPDPTAGESFDVGTVGVAYYDVVYVKCPSDAQQVSPLVPFSLPLDSVRMNSIVLGTNTSLASVGLSLECNNNGDSPNPCMFLPTHNYCGSISGTPTTAGTWPVTINITVFSSAVAGFNQIDYPMTGYELTINDEGTITVSESKNSDTFNMEQNSPNPASDYTTINYTLASSDEVFFSITNLIGEKMYSKAVKAKRGSNTLSIDTTEIPNGIYLYSIQTGNKKVTKRMVIQH